MEDKIAQIKSWLGTGSINFFGLPMSGKDTQGLKLAEAISAKFLSSGLIIRKREAETHQDLTGNGALIPTNVFYDWVLPYFERKDLRDFPLVLSSIGRWSGEEDTVMTTAASAGHEIKAVILLDLTREVAITRFDAAKTLNDRGHRTDDNDPEVFKTRLEEFQEKTLPVLEHYRDLGLLIAIDGNQTREQVFADIIDQLYTKSLS
ncbi:nucleoside monophosphate kinase [Candidatus Saccharibacteria bacterium]|nr:nucleoside monophosphate kinase [Candidatus Saccharibacteria bacterium]